MLTLDRLLLLLILACVAYPLVTLWWAKGAHAIKRRRWDAQVPRCGICQRELPQPAVRTHDGKWRCAQHKGR